MARTESDQISKAPIKVTLGTAEYDIHPLTILKSRQWRTKLNDTMSGIVSNMGAEATQSGTKEGLTAVLLRFPEKVAELVFAYAPNLPEEKILQEATEEQMSVAFGHVMGVAFPFVAQIQTALTIAKSR